MIPDADILRDSLHNPVGTHCRKQLWYAVICCYGENVAIQLKEVVV
jgi:hypothetical protein